MKKKKTRRLKTSIQDQKWIKGRIKWMDEAGVMPMEKGERNKIRGGV